MTNAMSNETDPHEETRRSRPEPSTPEKGPAQVLRTPLTPKKSKPKAGTELGSEINTPSKERLGFRLETSGNAEKLDSVAHVHPEPEPEPASDAEMSDSDPSVMTQPSADPEQLSMYYFPGFDTRKIVDFTWRNIEKRLSELRDTSLLAWDDAGNPQDFPVKPWNRDAPDRQIADCAVLTVACNNYATGHGMPCKF
jgi:hypothetical protein